MCFTFFSFDIFSPYATTHKKRRNPHSNRILSGCVGKDFFHFFFVFFIVVKGYKNIKLEIVWREWKETMHMWKLHGCYMLIAIEWMSHINYVFKALFFPSHCEFFMWFGYLWSWILIMTMMRNKKSIKKNLEQSGKWNTKKFQLISSNIAI